MHPYLMQSIELGPKVVARLLSLIPPTDYDRALGDDRFTVREVVAHLADWEVLFRARMELAKSQPGSPITTHDEGARAIELNYAESDIHAQLKQFIDERAKTAAFLRSLSPNDFRLTYIHPALGAMVIEDQANMLIGHDMYHIEQLTAYLD